MIECWSTIKGFREDDFIFEFDTSGIPVTVAKTPLAVASVGV